MTYSFIIQIHVRHIYKQNLHSGFHNRAVSRSLAQMRLYVALVMTRFDVLLTVHLSIIFAINQLNAQNLLL